MSFLKMPVSPSKAYGSRAGAWKFRSHHQVDASGPELMGLFSSVLFEFETFPSVVVR